MDRIVPIEKVETKNGLRVSPRTLKALKEAYIEVTERPYDDSGLVGCDSKLAKEKNCCCIDQRGCSNIYCYGGTTNIPILGRFADNCASCYKLHKEEFVFKPPWIK